MYTFTFELDGQIRSALQIEEIKPFDRKKEADALKILAGKAAMEELGIPDITGLIMLEFNTMPDGYYAGIIQTEAEEEGDDYISYNFRIVPVALFSENN